MSAGAWRVRYDRLSDVLYLSKRPEAPARSREEEPGVVWRYDAARGDLVGVTIIDFAAFWGRRRPELVNLIARRFALSRKAVLSQMLAMHPRAKTGMTDYVTGTASGREEL